MSGRGPAAAVLPAMLLALLLFVADASASPAPRVEARGLMRDMAVLVIDGRERIVRAGQTSPEGVELIASNPKEATIRVGEQTFTIGLSQAIGGRFVAPQAQEVRIARDGQGHYRVNGTIDGRSVPFLVDTGATVLTMSSEAADRIGIDYRSGPTTGVQTASGQTQAFVVTLGAVEVGGVVVNGVEAVVIEGAYPLELLLGMSFLSHFGMQDRAGVLTLTRDY